MALLKISGEKLKLELSSLEKLGAFHSSPEVDVSQVESIAEVPNPWTSTILKGVRAPGTGIPYVIMLGTLRYRGGKDFCAIYKRQPHVVISLKSGEFKRWIVAIGDRSEFESIRNELSKR